MRQPGGKATILTAAKKLEKRHNLHLKVVFKGTRQFGLLYFDQYWRRFLKGSNFCTKFGPLNNFFKPRVSYHFKV